MTEYAQAITDLPSGGDDSLAAAILERTVTSVNSSNVTKLGLYAFRECSLLSYVNLPNCSIIDSSSNYQPFSGCSALETVYMNNLIEIPDSTFTLRSSLREVSFSECTYIGSNAFYNCIALTNISFPNCLEINASAFNGCRALTEVAFPECTTGIHGYAFASCSALTSISFPKCISVGQAAF